jgi:two-component system chemotaxis sensor kinase CheA
MVDLELTPEILEQFKTESRECVNAAEAALLPFNKPTCTKEAIHEIFRSIHTIKGSADYLGLKELKELSHTFENILDDLRKDGRVSIPAEQLELFFDVLDTIKLMIEAASFSGEPNGIAYDHLIRRLGELRPTPVNSLQPPISVGSTDRSLIVFRETVVQQQDVLVRAMKKLEFSKHIDPAVRGMVARAFQGIQNASQFIGEEELQKSSGDLRAWVLSPALCSDGQDLGKRIDQHLEKLSDFLKAMNFRQTSPIQNQAVFAQARRETPQIVQAQAEAKPVESNTVRVNQEVLDGFMNLVGELIVARNGFSHIQTKLVGREEERILALKEFREVSSRLTHITTELQRNVMEMRMVPVKTLFQRYPRIVRDVCNKTGKTVEVVFEGENTEIDKGIADQISESLIHIVRNAVDHGIESGQERKSKGKTESGTLILKASHQGNTMVIEIIDDGRGIDVVKIREKAVEKGLMSLSQAEGLANHELFDLLFAPGFSTAANVTDISGRGVGLDVAKTNLKKIKGSVSVSTELEQGTCFRLEVPLTMAIMRALLVKSDEAIYAIALQDVTETVKVSASDLKSIRQKKAITLRGEIIMVECLSEILDHHLNNKVAAEIRLSILILQVNGNRFGLIVDSVFRQEDIVVKPLPESYSSVPGLSGASILGDGKAILILDSNQLSGLLTEKDLNHGSLKSPVVNLVA